MSRIDDTKGVLKTLFWLTKEELNAMDHKLFRITASIIAFLVVASFWYIIFNGTPLF